MRSNSSDVTVGRAIRISFGIVVFAAAVYVIFRQFEQYELQSGDIVRNLRTIPMPRVLASMLCIILDYLVMTNYDRLALQYIRGTKPPRPNPLLAFIGQTFTINTNFLIGTSIRHRLYSRLGLSLSESTTLSTFSFTSFIFGFLFIGGIVFLVEPVLLPQFLHVPFGSVRILGALFLAAILVYLIASALQIRLVRVHKWHISIPSIHIAWRQILFSSIDWLFTSSALYLLLPLQSILLFPAFLGTFLVASLLGQVSQAPAGIGVFEAAMLVTLSGSATASSVLGSLIVFRVLYFFIPLLIGIGSFLSLEFYTQKN